MVLQEAEATFPWTQMFDEKSGVYSDELISLINPTEYAAAR